VRLPSAARTGRCGGSRGNSRCAGRGVWLDRGELDKIIDRSGSTTSSPSAPSAPAAPSQYGNHKPKKKSSFLSELFELGG
jgi:Zn-finger nucleic acid-binding protein